MPALDRQGSCGRTVSSVNSSKCSRSVSGKSTSRRKIWIGRCLANSPTNSHSPRFCETLDQLDRQRAHTGFQRLDRLRAERRGEDRPARRMLGRIVFQRVQPRGTLLLRRDGDVPVREPLVIHLHHVDVVRAGRDPVAAVVRSPDDVGTRVQPAPGKMHVFLVAWWTLVVEVDHQGLRHVGRNCCQCRGHQVAANAAGSASASARVRTKRAASAPLSTRWS